MAIEYNENMDIGYYQTNEIEICNGEEYILYFENINDFIKLIKTDIRFYNDLKKKLEDE